MAVPPAHMVVKESDSIFDPFRRWDRYGRLGKQPQPWQEQLRLFVFTLFIVPIKALGAFLAVLSYWTVCQLSAVLPRHVRYPLVAELGKIHCRVCLFFLGFIWIRRKYVHPAGWPTNPAAKPAGIISNHAGYCDILAAMSLYFPSFVARESTQRIPLIGIISQMMGCLYVDRAAAAVNNGAVSKLAPPCTGTGHSMVAKTFGCVNWEDSGLGSKVKERMEQVAAGTDPTLRPLLLYPEGTTTNNRYMLPFRTGAFLAGEPLQPILLEYSQDGPFSVSWESVPIQQHLYLLLANPFHWLTIHQFPIYVPSDEERKDPKIYASNVRKALLDASWFKPSTATFADKQAYLGMVGVNQDVKVAVPKKTQ